MLISSVFSAKSSCVEFTRLISVSEPKFVFNSMSAGMSATSPYTSSPELLIISKILSEFAFA